MGTAELYMEPDGASFSFQQEAEAPQESAAREKAEAAARALEQAILDLKVPGLTVSHQQVTAEPYWLYGSQRVRRGNSPYSFAAKGNPAGYFASVALSARVDHTAGRARTCLQPLLDLLRARMLNSQVRYSWDDPEHWKQLALKAATTNALDRARAMAEAAGIRILRVEYLGTKPSRGTLQSDKLGPSIKTDSSYTWSQASATVWVVAVY